MVVWTAFRGASGAPLRGTTAGILLVVHTALNKETLQPCPTCMPCLWFRVSAHHRPQGEDGVAVVRLCNMNNSKEMIKPVHSTFSSSLWLRTAA